MKMKSTEQEAVGGASVNEARHPLHVVHAVQPSTKTSVAVDESLRELLEAFKHPLKD